MEALSACQNMCSMCGDVLFVYSRDARWDAQTV